MTESRNAARPRFGVVLFTLAATLSAFVAIGPADAKGPSIKKATFAKGVSKDFKAESPGTSFAGTEKILLLLEFSGRPKKGVIESIWRFREKEVARTKVDLASVNSGVFLSFGESTFVKFFFTPDATSPLPVGSAYDVLISVDGAKAGIYNFSISPPKGAGPTKVGKVVLAKGVTDTYQPVDETTNFGPADTVNLVFNGDYGIGTWVEVTWTVAGKVDPLGTRSLTIEENLTGKSGSFSFIPKGGWPVGKHSVAFVVNGATAGRYNFTVA
jgi:hypothetical protein